MHEPSFLSQYSMFGGICVGVAFLFSILAGILYVLVACGHERLRQWARFSYVMVAQGVIWAAVHLMFLVWHHRFEVTYVAEYSDRSLGTLFLISSFWAGQQGTFFLWAIYGCVLGVVFMTRCKKSYEAPAMAVLALIQVFLSGLLTFASPFLVTPTAQIPPDGQGLNVLLQNPWMVIHPPIMFLGFSSMAVPFAVGVSALVRRSYDDWVDVAWPWVLFAWCALGTGLFMGGYWAYTVLGWGGFWGWDNVENSSLIPWLATTALIHGMILQRSRGTHKRANMLFCLTPYVLVLFGSFLTRSGILADFSVHSFAAPARKIFDILLGYVCLFFVGAVGLLLSRVRSIPSAPAFEESNEFSRGFFFVIGTWVLYFLSLMIMVGTAWPLISRIWGKPGNATQWAYNHFGFPVAILLCIMMGITPFLKWQGRPSEASGRTLSLCVAGAAVLALLLTVANGYFFGESLRAPADALIRSNPSAYMAPSSPRPSGAVLNGRTTAQGAVTTSSSTAPDADQAFNVPQAPQTIGAAYAGALRTKNGYAFPILAFAAFFCILANGVMVYKISGITRRSWLPAGGFITHIGVAVLLIGVITSMNYGGDAVLNLDPGVAEAPDFSTPNVVKTNYRNPVTVTAFGHSFSLQGFDVEGKQGERGVIRVAVVTGDQTNIARPSLTIAKDGNMVHFPAIFKYWDEDLYLSPIKPPGMDPDPNNREFKFHAAIEVTHAGRVTILSPGISFGSSSGPHPTDTPALPGSDSDLVLQMLQTPTQDAPDRPTVADLTIHRPGSFTASSHEPLIHLGVGQTGSYRDYRFRFVKATVDPVSADVRMGQVEVSTKPMIDLVWLGTFLVIGGGILALVRRGRIAHRK